MNVRELKEVLEKLDDDTEVLCAGEEIECIADYGDAIVIDSDDWHHIDLLPDEDQCELLWQPPHRAENWERELDAAAE
jgi:hypothetical protein